ncbi:unnamed protein product [Trypanosoma congolense IL3000]|uniref:WGS project CAEQ00000000 data, annotated contig 482 n=1 Tax=Trypanosoma congolense (strain IL3000) TaxID=1068625 RepID=F9WGB0_TRYCI|nr:unnamed protein product [Trypanosoma congolense IL3000]
MYFPLRVERINPDVAQGEPCVVAVWCSANRTVLLTSEMEWLSCGLPISRSPCGMSGQWQRMDRYGALGRWIKHCGEAYTFGKMQWSNKVKAAVESLALSPTEESSLDAVLNSIHLFCSNHIVALLVPGNRENCKSLLFVQGEKPNVQIVHNGERTPIAAIAGADKLLQDCTVDDDSYVYPLSKGHAIVACDHFVVVL